MEVKVNWLGKRAFEGVNKLGSKTVMDIPEDKGGEQRGPSPKEVYLMSLASCTGIDIISILEKKRIEVTSFEIIITSEDQTERHPYTFKSVKITFYFKGKNLTEPAVKQAVTLSQEKYCGISAMMKKAFDVEYEYKFENIEEQT